MKKGRVQKLWLLQLLLIFAFLVSGCGAQGQQPQNEKLYMEYYYVPACENCEDGPGYAAILEGMVDDVMERGTDYELEVKSLADQEVYAQFQEIVETYQTDDFYPTPPVLKIGSEYLFGEDQIEAKTRSTAIAQLNAMLTPEQVKQRLGVADPEDSVFIYLYKEDCPYCEEIETYLTGLDSIQYLEDGRESPLKIFYVDAGDVDNMPLVGALYEQYQVPEEDQKSPMILWKGGYAMGRQAIREAMVPAIVNGEALGWPGWDQVPVS